jgi:hypothetical protein
LSAVFKGKWTDYDDYMLSVERIETIPEGEKALELLRGLVGRTTERECYLRLMTKLAASSLATGLTCSTSFRPKKIDMSAIHKLI